MKRVILSVSVLSVVVGITTAWAHGGPGSHEDQSASGQAELRSSRAPASVVPGQRLTLNEATKKRMGSFELRSGKTISILTANTVDGMVCLLEQGHEGEASSCVDKGFFAFRNVEYLESSQGGPEKFSELHVTGVVAPGIRSAVLVKADGSSVQLDLNRDGAFLFDAPASDLEEGVYPSAFRLFGPSGKLVESFSFPP